MITLRPLILALILVGSTTSWLQSQPTLQSLQIEQYAAIPDAEQRYHPIFPLRNLSFAFQKARIQSCVGQEGAITPHISFSGGWPIQRGVFTPVFQQYVRSFALLLPMVESTRGQEEKIKKLQSSLEESQQRYDQLYEDHQALMAQMEALETYVDQLLGQEPRQASESALTLTPILQQNSPNPFRRETNIEYFVPPGYQTASIHISTVEGKVVRQIALSQSGRSTLHLKTGTFPAGTYQYSLIIDGKLIDTKRMVISK